MPHPFDLTPEFVLSLGPCWAPDRVRQAFGDRLTVRLSDAVSEPSLSNNDAVWLGCRALWEIDQQAARRFAVVVARWASIRFGERETIETPDGPRWQGRPTPTARVTWGYIHGTATEKELAAAMDAAMDAAKDAAKAAAKDAAKDAAMDAAWDAAWAAMAAAKDAAKGAAWDAAWAAARDAARDAARKHLVRMIRRAENARAAAR